MTAGSYDASADPRWDDVADGTADAASWYSDTPDPTADLPVADDAMFAGLPRRVVELFAPHTEASPVAIAAQFIVAFGSAVGRGPRVYVGETAHHANEFLALVGTTSRARKGDSKNAALRCLAEADPDWSARVAGGLSSGEGLIHAVRDPVNAVRHKGKDAGEEYVADPGVADKRLLVVESEFSGALKQFSRDANILSNVLRDAWDGKYVLRTMTKHSPTAATDAHVSLIAHTTPADLRVYLPDVEAANGTGNRFLFALVHRDKLLPWPGRADPAAVSGLAEDVRDRLERARQRETVRLTRSAERLWRDVYPALTEEHPGLPGAMLARAEAHVVRLGFLYALMDGADSVDVDHILSGLACWKYCDASVRRIFGDRTGSDAADRILSELAPGDTIALSAMRRDIFHEHISAAKLQDAVRLLVRLGAVTVTTERTPGRPRLMVTRRDTNGDPLREKREKREKGGPDDA